MMTGKVQKREALKMGQAVPANGSLIPALKISTKKNVPSFGYLRNIPEGKGMEVKSSGESRINLASGEENDVSSRENPHFASGRIQFDISTEGAVGGATRGVVSSWPAPEPGVSPRKKQNADPNADTKAKPVFLIELEKSIKNELKVLNCPENGPDDGRLQVYSMAFESLVDTFRVYRPLLSKIKLEYDLVLESLRRQVSVLSPLKPKIAALKEETVYAISKMQDDFVQKIDSQNRIIKDFQDTVNELQFRATESEDRIMELSNSLKNEKELNKESYEQRMVLLNQIKSFEEDSVERTRASRREREQLEENKRKLNETQEDLSKILIEQYALKNELSKMIPKSKLILAVQEKNGLQETLDRLKPKHMQLLNDYEKLKQKHGEQQAQHEDTVGELEQMKGRGTPRPEWDILLEPFPTLRGADDAVKGRTHEVINTILKSYQDLIDELDSYTTSYEDESRPSKDNQGPRYFDPLGTGPDVPKYLRTNDKVRNKKLTKRDTEMLIKDIWRERHVYETRAKKQGKAPDEDMNTFVYGYLRNRFGVHASVLEWGYSFLDALERYKYDNDCELMLKVINGDLGAMVHDEQLVMVDKLLDAFVKLDAHDGKVKGIIKKKDAMRLMRVFFGAKSSERFKTVKDAINADQPGPQLEYRKLFAEDRDGNQGAFMESVRDQFIEEREEFLQDIAGYVREVQSEETGLISLEDVYRMFEAIDKYKSKAEIEKYVNQSWNDEERRAGFCLGDTFLERLKAAAGLYRTGLKGCDEPPISMAKFQWKSSGEAVMAAGRLARGGSERQFRRQKETDGAAAAAQRRIGRKGRSATIGKI